MNAVFDMTESSLQPHCVSDNGVHEYELDWDIEEQLVEDCWLHT